MSKKSVNQSHVRIINQRLIVENLKEEGTLSRADLSKRINMSKPSITVNVEMLIDRGMIRELGRGEAKSRGGRRPMMLELNKEFCYFASVHIHEDKSEFIVSNLVGEVVDSRVEPHNGETYTIDYSDTVSDVIEELLKKRGINVEKLKAVVVVLPTIDELIPDAGRAFDVEDWKENLGNRLQTSVLLYGHAHVCALGEYKNADEDEIGNLLYIDAGEHLSVGLIIDSKLHLGEHGISGALGRNRSGLGDYCQTLGESVSLKSLLARVDNDLETGIETSIKPANGAATFDELVSAVLAGDEYACTVVKEAATRVGGAIRNICGLLDLEYVVIGGDYTRFEDVFVEAVKESVTEGYPYDIYSMESALGHAAAEKGAISLAQEYVFNEVMQ